MKNKNFYISTAIVYSTQIPHIGNMYEMVLADAIARFKKLDGYNVYFQTGSDEHGLKIFNKARENNLTPQQFVDEVSLKIKKEYELLNIKYDYFFRTTNDYHKKTVQDIFDKLLKNKDVYLGKYEGLYLPSEEAFVLEKELIDGKSKNGETPVFMSEDAYFFNLKKYQKRLIEHINNNPEFIVPESRKNEMLKFLEEELQDLCITRTAFDWGIPLSFDKKHVVYVWIDALSNYITGLGYNPNGKSDERFNNFWPCDLHLIGKDILRFHAIFWPILLMALDIPLPKKIFAHPWVLFNKDKMSKSKGNVIYTKELIDKFGVDPIRYYCLHEIPFKEDGNLTYELVTERNNSDLSNTIGNLLNRTLGMLKKYNGSKLVKNNCLNENESTKELINKCEKALSEVRSYIDEVKVADSLDIIMDLARYSNKYIDLNEPWSLFKNNEIDKLNSFLYNIFESIRFIGILLEPFLPETAEKIKKALKLNKNNDNFESLDKFGQIEENELELAPILFQRFEL